MTKETIIKRIADEATPGQLEAIAAILEGNGAIHMRIVSQREAARMLGYKCTATITRMLDAGILKEVFTPSGFRKVTLQSVHDYLAGKAAERPFTPTKAQMAHYGRQRQAKKDLRKA